MRSQKWLGDVVPPAAHGWPAADVRAEGLAHEHGDAARGAGCASAVVQPHAVAWDVWRQGVTRKMSLSDDDDVSVVPIGGQQGGELANKAAATIPE